MQTFEEDEKRRARAIKDPALPDYPPLPNGNTRRVEIRLPYAAHVEGDKLIVEMPVGKLPAPMFTDALIEHCLATLGKRDGAKLLDSMVEDYYRKLVLAQM